MDRSPVSIDKRALGRREVLDASRLAVRCFFEGPFFSYLWPGESLRRHALRVTHRTVLAHSGPDAYVRTVRGDGGAIESLALWLPPGAYPLKASTQLAQLPGVVRANYRRPRTMVDGFAFFKASALAHPREPHWYLQLLMTEPSRQRHGLGTALMEDGLARADAAGVGSSLETQNGENLAFYARFGYELRTTIRPVSTGPALYSMWRAPR